MNTHLGEGHYECGPLNEALVLFQSKETAEKLTTNLQNVNLSEGSSLALNRSYEDVNIGTLITNR